MDKDLPQSADSAPAPAVATGAEGDVASYKGEVDIYARQRLPHLDQGPVKAYAAGASRGGAGNTHYALICEPALVPRIRSAQKMAAIINPSLARLIGAGVVNWPPAKAQRYTFIYENTMGTPLVPPDKIGGLGWKPERVIQGIVKPMLSVLMDMRDKDLVHGNIRPTNMFLSGSAGNERVVLGDCLATPPGLLQPMLFEPVERAMTDPLARGQGSFEDDLYAFGVTLTYIMRTRDPMEGMTDQEIIQEKMEMGSYAALTGKERFTGGILELLRGLLYDDRTQRWTLDEIELWDQGQRLSPKQAARKVKASRPIHFNEERYFRPTQLAMDLHKNPAEAVQIVDNDTLNQWVSRSLEDKQITGRLEEAVASAQEQGRGPGYAERILSRLSAALDPEAPIRYAGMTMHPEGLPSVMANAYMTKQNMQYFVDIINQGLVMLWLQNQPDVRLDVGGLIARYDGSRSYLRQTIMGYGLERCLYFLCPELHCLSERLSPYFVTSPEELMRAYEDLSTKSSRPELFVDRHVAAFLSVKDRRMIDPFLNELNAPEYFKKVLANIKTVATIQKRSRMEAFPGISKWCADLLGPIYERYHDRDFRVKLKEKIEKAKETGDISKIIALIDNAETVQRDFIDFRRAMKEYHDLREEHNTLRHKMEKRDDYGRDIGREVAAVVSGVLAGILILAFSFLFFTKGGPF